MRNLKMRRFGISTVDYPILPLRASLYDNYGILIYFVYFTFI